MTSTRLIVQADDFGMCHAVNQGIAESFRHGIVTQTSVMAPCPWVDEATQLAGELEIPIGVHGTLTCEWEHLRWRPLTAGASLRESDGTMHRTVEGAIASVDAKEVADELLAQVAYLQARALEPIYLDCHMGPCSGEGFSEACRRSGLKFTFPLIDECMALASIAMLSPIPAREKKSWLLDRLGQLEPGDHLILAHPAIDTPELRAITHTDADNYVWAEQNRTSDLAVLLDPDVAARIESLRIELVTAADL